MADIRPSLDRFVTVPELLDFHSNATRPIYVFAKDGAPGITEISYLEFVRASHRVAHSIRSGRSGPDRTVIAVVALADTLVYEVLIAGIMKAGLVPLLISPRNTPAAVLSLLKSSGAHRVLTTHATLADLINGVKTELESPGEDEFDVSFEEIPCLAKLFPKLGAEMAADSFEPYPTSAAPDADHIAIYLHSSGSTGFPKAIPWTHRGLFHWASFSSVIDLRDSKVPMRIGAMSLPPFHAYSFWAQFLCTLYASVTVALYPPVVTTPDAHPIMPSPGNILVHLERTKANCVTVVPSMVLQWSHSPLDVDVLRSLEVVIFAGGPLPPVTGNDLVSAGVHLRSLYGGTEFGIPTSVNMAEDREDWEWNSFSDRVDINWVPQGDGTFECQFLTVETHALCVENLPHSRGYATSDIFVPHPRRKGLWKIVGRIDDVLIHTSGEKTVPAPIENVVLKSPLIQGAIMFGRERDQPGILIEPSPGNEVDVNDQSEVSHIRNSIWPTIEEANRAAPAFSKLYKEMILIASSMKPLPRAAKGTVLRKAAIRNYEEEIARIYEVVESNASSGSVHPPLKWRLEYVQQWLTEQVEDLCGVVLPVSADMFENGLDSLSATILRLRVVGALRASTNSSVQAISKVITQNTLYTHPTIEGLTRLVVGLTSGGTKDGKVDTEETQQHVSAIKAMIAKYSQGLDEPIPRPDCDRAPSKAVVLLTGSTGSLGAEILAMLLSNKAVARVYAMNRPSTQMPMLDRHRARFEDKGLDVGLLSSEKVVFLEGESTRENIGLDEGMLHELKADLTMIIHNAWRVDFNFSLLSFENHVRGVRNLIDLARSSRFALSLRFLFTSTIASTQSWDAFTRGPYPEEVIPDPQFAVGAGYGEGKYVSERILSRSGLNFTSFRIGQISGGQNGAWATSDWLPMIVKSSLALGVLPDAYGVVSWLPMDATAEAILDTGLSSASDRQATSNAINLVHPHPVPWSAVMKDIRQSLIEVKGLSADALPLVPFSTWFEALEKLAEDAEDQVKTSSEAPATKILEFLRGMKQADERLAHFQESSMNENMEAVGLTPLRTNNIQRISPRIGCLDRIGAREVDLWVRYWARMGL